MLDVNYEWLEYVIFQSHGKGFFPLRKSGKALGITLGVVLVANFLEEFKITGFVECVESLIVIVFPSLQNGEGELYTSIYSTSCPK